LTRLLDKIKGIVNDWKRQNPNEFHTPEGMDELKKVIGIELEKIPFEQATLTQGRRWHLLIGAG